MSGRRMRLADQTRPSESVVEWPHSVVSEESTDDDLGPPLAQLLIDLGIKGTDADQAGAAKVTAAFTGTPISVAIIEAGATAASKGWAGAMAALGGGATVWAAASNFWRLQPQGVQGPLVIAVAIVIAACALSAGLIMYGDVRARGQAAAAQYHARATIAGVFLEVAAELVPSPNPTDA